MRGTDCTAEQIRAASDFLEIASWRPDTAKAEVTRDDIVRLLAWYGALLFRGGRDGTGGTLEHPGQFDVNPTPSSQAGGQA